ncbi:MAG: class I SAM-dependent methyltransferase [Gaiellaceae bacterium]
MARAAFEEQLRRSGVVLRSPEALRRIVRAPGELGFARAYVAGDLDIEGDVYEALELLERRRALSRVIPELLPVVRDLGIDALRPLPPPPEETRLRGRRHSKARDAAAIAHHYDVSNRFYRLVLGPSLTYSCAVFADPAATLEEAQEAKHELVARKLGLGEGMRLLDVGCGWGSMLVHAAERHGVSAIGITNSRRQAELARERVRAAGLADRVEIRLADYRDVTDGPYDAISSIGMFEHVGQAQLELYFARLHVLLRPGGRLLNHGIGRPPGRRRLLPRRTFVNRYVFPDGELQEVGAVASRMQTAGLELRHLESLREHYALTLRHWVRNLESSWEEAVAEVGIARARIWRLYMAGSALGFEDGGIGVHQVLGVVPTPEGDSGMPLTRESWG